MTHLKCFSFTTILLFLVLEAIIDAAPNPGPLDELTLNINIKEPNIPNVPNVPKVSNEPNVLERTVSKSKPGSETTRKLCGLKKRSEEDESGIINGQDTKMNEYPWMVGLDVDGWSYPHCGGSLIASQWVLTAHHCLGPGQKQGKANGIFVILGDHIHNRKNETKIEKRLKVEEWFTFADNGADGEHGDGDIALLKLEEPVDLSVYTPVCLPTKGDTINKYIGKDAWVYGWGFTLEAGTPSDTLQDVKIEVISNAECSENYRKVDKTIKPGIMVCAGDRNATQIEDSCKGDSGGPLSLADQDGSHTQIGIVSWGWFPCAQPGLFGVYTNVFYFNDWIHQTMDDNSGRRTTI